MNGVARSPRKKRAAPWRRRFCHSVIAKHSASREGSVHASSWPEGEISSAGDTALLGPVSDVLGAIRRTKTEAKLSQRAAVEELTVEGPSSALEAIEACRTDLSEAGGIAEFSLSEGPNLVTTVRLAPSTDAKVAH